MHVLTVSQSLNLFSKTFEIRVFECILSQYPLLCFKLGTHKDKIIMVYMICKQQIIVINYVLYL